MNDDIINAIRLLVEDGAEVTYNRTSDFEVPEFFKETYRLQERERIIKLLDNPLHHNIQSPDIHKDCYTCVLLALIKGEQE